MTIRLDSYNLILISNEEKEVIDQIQEQLKEDGWYLPSFKQYQEYYLNSNPVERLVMENTLKFIDDLRTNYEVVTSNEIDDAMKQDSYAFFQREYQRINNELVVSGASSKYKFDPKDGSEYLQQLVKLPAEITGYNTSLIQAYIDGEAMLATPDALSLFGFQPYIRAEDYRDNYFEWNRIDDHTLLIGYPIERGDAVYLCEWLTDSTDTLIKMISGNHRQAIEYLFEDNQALVNDKEPLPIDVFNLLNILDLVEDVCHYFGYTAEEMEQYLENYESEGYQIERDLTND